MDATFTVTFKGFPDKFAALLDRWVEEDIAGYPKRMAMDSASVKKVKLAEKGKSRGKSR
jgi:hypothetical protein